MSYLDTLWKALLGGAETAGPAGDDAAWRAKVAALELDLVEAKRRAEKMREEYASLQTERDRASTAGGQDQLERLFKKLAGPLSNLAALADMAEAGGEVAASDFAQLVRSLEKELARAGLERIGKAGEETSFDTALHQRMSGGSVHAGTPVTVRVPGYRAGEKIVLKALVSTREAGRG
jgi:molecular chaperone GrpE (heat shock protein)